MWMEEAAKDRLRFERTDLSTLSLHGIGTIDIPRIGYSGRVAFDFRCGDVPLLMLDEPTETSIVDEIGSATGTLNLGECQCAFECADLTSETSINSRLELHPAPNSELILKFSGVSDSATYVVFLSNIPVELASMTSVGGVRFTMERVSHPMRVSRLERRRPEYSRVTTCCTLYFKRNPRDFVSDWAKPISKFFQTYSGRPVDVVGWGRVNSDGKLLELHLPSDIAQPSSLGSTYARREDGFIDWEPFLQNSLAEYLRLSKTYKLGAFSQYLAMSSGPGITVNGKSAHLLPATELIANIVGEQHGLNFPEGRNLNAKIKAILDATRFPMSKAKRKALDDIVRARLRNPLLHEGLPDASVGTLDNAKINAFLKGLAVSLHSILIGNDAPHHYQHWDKHFHMTPKEWLASNHVVS